MSPRQFREDDWSKNIARVAFLYSLCALWNYRVFINYCVFPQNFLNFLDSASSTAALVFYLPFRGPSMKSGVDPEEYEYVLKFSRKKNTLFNEHPVCTLDYMYLLSFIKKKWLFVFLKSISLKHISRFIPLGNVDVRDPEKMRMRHVLQIIRLMAASFTWEVCA